MTPYISHWTAIFLKELSFDFASLNFVLFFRDFIIEEWRLGFDAKQLNLIFDWVLHHLEHYYLLKVNV